MTKVFMYTASVRLLSNSDLSLCFTKILHEIPHKNSSGAQSESEYTASVLNVQNVYLPYRM
jgi:hypothetical protein